MPREHGDDGAFVETITLDDVLEVFDAVDGPVILSADVADELSCSRETARRKLGDLHERGDLDRRKVSRRVIYWRPETTASASRDAARADADLLPTETPANTVDTEGAAEGAESDTLTDDLREHLDAVDAPPKTEHGRDALVDVVRLLREHGTMKTGELKQALYAEYSDHYKNERGLWESISRYLEDTPGVDNDSYGECGYTGDDAVREALEDDEE
jgi:hypothetical protein